MSSFFLLLLQKKVGLCRQRMHKSMNSTPRFSCASSRYMNLSVSIEETCNVGWKFAFKKFIIKEYITQVQSFGQEKTFTIIRCVLFYTCKSKEYILLGYALNYQDKILRGHLLKKITRLIQVRISFCSIVQASRFFQLELRHKSNHR